MGDRGKDNLFSPFSILCLEETCGCEGVRVRILGANVTMYWQGLVPRVSILLLSKILHQLQKNKKKYKTSCTNFTGRYVNYKGIT